MGGKVTRNPLGASVFFDFFTIFFRTISRFKRNVDVLFKYDEPNGTDIRM